MDIVEIMAEQPFFQPLDDGQRSLIAGCGRNVAFETDQLIAEADAPADHFYLLRRGQVALEIHTPERGAVPLQTLHPGDVLGWSWIFPPYRWQFDARATEPVGAVAFDGECLRGKCEADPALGYVVMKRFAEVLARRFAATRLQLLDVYGKPDDG